MLIAIIIVITLLPIVVGMLLGLLRGWRRSLLRLGLAGLSFILAFALCGVVSNAILGINVEDGVSIRQYIADALVEAMHGVDMSSLAVALAESVFKLVTFVLLFALLLFLTWAIVFPICKIFVKPGKDKNGNVKKRRLFGMLIGAGQGVMVALGFGVIISGLFFQVGRLGNAANQLATIDTEQVQAASAEPSDEVLPEEVTDVFQMFADYTDSFVGKAYNTLGDSMFTNVSRVTTTEGRDITLSGTVDAVEGIVDLAKEAVELQRFDFEGMFNGDNFDGDFAKLSEILDNLDDIKDNLSDEAIETIQTAFSGLSDAFDLPIDFGSIDIESVSFSKEGEIIKDLHGYTKYETITEDDAKDIVGKILESDIVIPVLQSTDMDVASYFGDKELDIVSDVIDQMETDGTCTGDKADALRDLFGF